MRKHKGFSLLELLVVIATIGIIAAIAVPNLMASRRSANEGSAISSLRALSSANVTFATTIGNGDYAGNIGTVDSSAMAELHSNNLVDPVLGSGLKGRYRFVGDRTAKSATTVAGFFLSANPAEPSGFNRGGNRRFGIATTGVVKYDSEVATLSVPFDFATLDSPATLSVE